ncbi:MAG: hypothetical protein CBC13_01680 [Planctomycetia bacterium TMED53]|nr:MAG: hypothetical protein CBC13_01680 [Planctomycetia bacterium TMED53]
MVSSKAKTPKEYIDQLPEDRRQTMRKLRALVRKHLPKGYVEVMRWGMLCYEVPLRTYPDTYNKEPLMYAALASQKNHYGVYLCGLYSFDKIQSRFVKAWKKRGVKLNMGKSCIRLKSWDECQEDLIAEVVSAVSVEDFVAHAKSLRK